MPRPLPSSLAAAPGAGRSPPSPGQTGCGHRRSAVAENPVSRTGRSGRLTGKTGRATEIPSALTEIPVGVRKSVSRCEICISRRELYISRRDFYISQREIDFTWCGGKFPQGCRSPCQAARQTQGRHACRRDGCRAAASGSPQTGNRRQCDRSPGVTSGAPTFPASSQPPVKRRGDMLAAGMAG